MSHSLTVNQPAAPPMARTQRALAVLSTPEGEGFRDAYDHKFGKHVPVERPWREDDPIDLGAGPTVTVWRPVPLPAGRTLDAALDEATLRRKALEAALEPVTREAFQEWAMILATAGLKNTPRNAPDNPALSAEIGAMFYWVKQEGLPALCFTEATLGRARRAADGWWPGADALIAKLKPMVELKRDMLAKVREVEKLLIEAKRREEGSR